MPNADSHSRLWLFTALVMLAFAANSLLNRAALVGDSIGAVSFALVRVAAGAVMLLVVLKFRGSLASRPKADGLAIASLCAYLLGFSLAYRAMDAGVGALILFGGVQLTMFAGALRGGDAVSRQRWIGAAISLAGLALLLWPSGPIRLSPTAFFLMCIAAVGWGVYSLIGRRATDPLVATAWNFVWSVPIILLAWLLLGRDEPIGAHGIGLAIVSGALTSGLGYAAWYSLLPALGATRAALAQLSVPVIALVLGVLLLGESVGLKGALASLLVIGGILYGMRRGKAA